MTFILFFDGKLHVSKCGWTSVFFSAESKICLHRPPPPHSHQSLNVFKSWLKFVYFIIATVMIFGNYKIGTLKFDTNGSTYKSKFIGTRFSFLLLSEIHFVKRCKAKNVSCL